MALSFNGGNYFYTQENPGVLDGLTEYTAMCWARPLRLSSFQACFSRQVATGSGETIWVGFNGTSYNTFISLSGGGFSITAGAPVLGQWVHIAVAFNQSPTARALMYINGSFLAAGTGTGTLPATTRGLFIAGNNNGGTPISLADSFQGELEDVRIYDRVLGPGTLNTIVAGKGKDGIYSGLLCLYGMIGPNGQTPPSVPNLAPNPTLNLITQANNPTFVPGITVARGRPTPRVASRA